jgi:cytochrome c biogenesis protein
MAEPARELSVSVVEDELGFHFRRGAALLDKVWYLFSSIKFALAVLLLLVVGSFIGLLIPQNGTEQEYLTKYGTFWTNVILFWHVNNTFFSWWYVTMEVVIGASIVVCSINRLPIAWRMAFTTTYVEHPRAYEVMPIRQSLALPVSPSEAERAVRRICRRRWYGVKGKTAGGSRLLSASKGQVSRLLPYVIHIGLELMLLGGVVGAMYSFSVPASAKNGQSVAVPGYSNEQVRVDSFQIVLNDHGDVKDYITWARVFESGRQTRAVEIRVNHPLVLHGIHYYQATYSQDPDRCDIAQLRLVRGPEGEELKRLAALPPMVRLQEQMQSARQPAPLSNAMLVPFGRTAAVSGTPYSLRVVRYVADFQVDTRSREIYSKSADPNNPAVLVELYEGEKKLYEDWVFLNTPIHIEPHPIEVEFLGFKPSYITGLQVAKHPGAPLLLVGFLFFAAGLLPMTVLYTHRQVYARIDPDGAGGSIVRLAGRTYKNKRGFELHFRELAAQVAAATGGEVQVEPTQITPPDADVAASGAGEDA